MRTYRKVLLSPILLSLAVAAPVCFGLDESHARIVQISYVEGTVELNNQTISQNTPVIEGNVLTTGSDSLAEVRFEDGSTMRLASETQVTFAELSRSGSGDEITRVALDKGEAVFNISRRMIGTFSLDAHQKNVVFTSAGRFRVLSTSSDPLELAVWKGEAVVHDPQSGQDVAVKKNEIFALSATDPEQYDLEEGIEADALDQWSKMREQYLASNYVSNNQPATVLPVFGFDAFGFGDPCQPYLWAAGYGYSGYSYYGQQPYWYSWQPYWTNAYAGSCFGPSFFYPPAYAFFPIFPHRHHFRPHIHPPVAPLTARFTAVRPVGVGAINGRLMNPGGLQHGVRVFNEENLRNSVNASELARLNKSKDSGKHHGRNDSNLVRMTQNHDRAKHDHSQGQQAHRASSSSRSFSRSYSSRSSSGSTGSRGFSGSSHSSSSSHSSGGGSSSHSSSGGGGGRGH